MRRVVAGLLALIAVASLVGLVGTTAGALAGSPMLFARALVVSAGLFVVAIRWRGGGRRRS